MHKVHTIHTYVRTRPLHGSQVVHSHIRRGS
jgi:hypothetical protein